MKQLSCLTRLKLYKLAASIHRNSARLWRCWAKLWRRWALASFMAGIVQARKYLQERKERERVEKVLAETVESIEELIQTTRTAERERCCVELETISKNLYAMEKTLAEKEDWQNSYHLLVEAEAAQRWADKLRTVGREG